MNPKAQLARIRKTNELLAEAVRDAREDIATVSATVEFTQEAKQKAIAARRDELREEIEAIRRRGATAIEKLRAGEPGPKKVELGEAERIWRRQRRLLDHGTDPLALAEELVDRGDADGLAVLQIELPDHLRAIGDERRVAEATMTAIRKVETPLLSGERAEYRGVLDEAEKAATLAETNCGLVGLDLEATEKVIGPTPDDGIQI